jgi:bicarbonate transport system ATP-binding protein
MTATSTPPAGKSKTTNQDFICFEKVTKTYPSRAGLNVVIQDIDLTVKQGEFICIIGHSGCGKSTLLNTLSGFATPNAGQVTMNGNLITKPGPDRMMVFQSYSLMPWMTAYENVYFGLDSVHPNKSKSEKDRIVRDTLTMVGLGEAMEKQPTQFSGGMRLRPEVLILDEPFGALDAITKEEMQEEVSAIVREVGCTVIMVTHDIDECLFLADRLVMMTEGPAAGIGEILDIPFERPRDREQMLEDPRYYDLRNRALEFLYSGNSH